MSTYRSTQDQRDAVQAFRTTFPKHRSLVAPACWRVIEAMRADDELDVDTAVARHAFVPQPDAQGPAHVVSVVDEPSAVVEYDAAGFLVALDAESMVARGLTKADTDDLMAAMDVIAAWCDPLGRSFRMTYTVEGLVRQAQLARGAAGRPDLRLAQVEARVVELLDNAANDPDRIVVGRDMRRQYPIAVDLDNDSDLPPVKLHLAYTQLGSAAHQRGEECWVIVHQPVYETYTDRQTGEIRTGQSRWASKGSKFLGVARTFASEYEACEAFDELRSALAVYRRITSLLEAGDPRYTDDPVRLGGVQRDVQARMPREQALA